MFDIKMRTDNFYSIMTMIRISVYWEKFSHSIVTILFPPRMKIVTALEFLHFSIINILSFVVPKLTSRTKPAKPSFSGVNSSNRGTMRPPVAMAINCKYKDSKTPQRFFMFFHQNSHLDFRPSNPTNSWKFSLQQQVIGFIVETPLANC